MSFRKVPALPEIPPVLTREAVPWSLASVYVSFSVHADNLDLLYRCPNLARHVAFDINCPFVVSCLFVTTPQTLLLSFMLICNGKVRFVDPFKIQKRSKCYSKLSKRVQNTLLKCIPEPRYSFYLFPNIFKL